MKDRRNRWESCLHMLLPGELRTKKSCRHARKKAGKYYVEKGKCEGCTYWEAWECVPERTVQEIITKDCKKCQYGSRNSDGARMTCDYIGDMGYRRPCKPGDCREAGVFKPRESVRRKQLRA